MRWAASLGALLAACTSPVEDRPVWDDPPVQTAPSIDVVEIPEPGAALFHPDPSFRAVALTLSDEAISDVQAMVDAVKMHHALDYAGALKMAGSVCSVFNAY